MSNNKAAKVKHINVNQLKRAIEKNKDDNEVDFINVCTPVEYKERHIEGVRNIPLDKIKGKTEELQDKQRIYIHCNSGNRSQQAIEALKNALPGVELINVTGGLQAWEEAEYPVNSLSQGLPLMRQVQLSAGSLILIGMVLSFTINSWFLIVPLIVGAGLTVAGATGWCGMAMLLSKMPWNR